MVCGCEHIYVLMYRCPKTQEDVESFANAVTGIASCFGCEELNLSPLPGEQEFLITESYLQPQLLQYIFIIPYSYTLKISIENSPTVTVTERTF